MSKPRIAGEGKEKLAFLFPGGDAWAVGMGHDLIRHFATSRAVYKEADEAAGFALSRMCFEGPEAELRQPANVQPAVVVTALAILRAAEEAGLLDKTGPPVFLAGNSLGQLVTPSATGMLGLADTVRLVKERGRLMTEANMMAPASPSNPGVHSVIIRLNADIIEGICRETGATLTIVTCPGNIVIGGTTDIVARAEELALSRGAYRVVRLTGTASHSPLMQPAARGLARFLSPFVFRDADAPVVANTTARPITRGEEMRAELVKQLVTTVLWQRTLEYMMEAGVTTFIEVAPARGESHADHLRRTNVAGKPLKILIISDYNTIKAAVKELAAGA